MEICGQRITLAHWRLSVIDPQVGSNQPFRRKPNGPVMVFNGEIYNYPELRRRIGGNFRTASDTEVLLAAYEKWGPDCLRHLRGMFAFVIVDPARKQVFAARDRFGIKPLYWRKQGSGWEFASEIKQLIDSTPRANFSRVRDFLFYGAQDHTAETMFEGVMQLRGGQSLLINLEHSSAATPRTWYVPPLDGSFNGSFEDASRAVRNKFFETVSLHLRSDVPLGFCLSGGMDSSALICTAGALQRDSGQNLIGINCRYPFSGLDEHGYAKDAANLSGAELLQLTPDFSGFLRKLEKITYFQDEPLNNASVFSQYSVFRTARERQLKVMIDGQGGDELLASYPQFFGPYLRGLLGRFKILSFFEESSHFRQDHAWGLMDTLQSLPVWFAPRFVFRTGRHFASGFAKNKWAKREFLFGNGLPMPPWQKPDRIANQTTTRSMSLLMLQQLSLPMLLHWEDRNSMAHSVESRVPFLDHELVELILSLPDEFKIRRGVTKRVLKSALRDIVPPSIAHRRDKMGFATPEEQWMRENSQDFADLIQSASSQFSEIFHPEGLSETWGAFVNGFTASPLLWRIAMLSIWARTFSVR
jgi:asparagine synthase (glutamine-hydrolysing)